MPPARAGQRASAGHGGPRRLTSGGPRTRRGFAATTALPLPALTFVVLLATIALVAATALAGAQDMTAGEFREIAAAAADSARAAGAIERLRHFIAGHPADNFVAPARQYLVGALVTLNAPADQIVAAAESALAAMTVDPTGQATFGHSVAAVLLDRREQLDKARGLAASALAGLPQDERFRSARLYARATLGGIQAARGEADSAIANLSSAAAELPSDDPGLLPRVLAALGGAFEGKGQTDEAIDAYVHSLGIYLARDSSARAPLNALYRKRYGSTAGLEQRIAEARDASRRRVVFDSRRDDRPAPPWTLRDLSGKIVESSQFKGKVVVMNFWGSWCGPCRMELPHFQKLYERYRGKGIAFLGMNWESPGLPEERVRAAKDFLAKNKYSFPVVLDHDALAAQAHGVNSFPTVFLVDKTGTIRFRNTGYSDGVDQIIEDQLLSLLK